MKGKHDFTVTTNDAGSGYKPDALPEPEEAKQSKPAAEKKESSVKPAAEEVSNAK